MNLQVYLIRHGETAWSITGQHTGHTDIPLTERGEDEAQRIAERLHGLSFAQVFTSPLLRAQRTCEVASIPVDSVVLPDLSEWNYGTYNGLTLEQILEQRPDWNVFEHGCPDGESPAEVARRADRVVERLHGLNGNVAVFSHGHFLRSLAVRWVGLPLTEARRLYLSTGSLSILGFEHHNRNEPVIQLWNERPETP